MHSILHYQLHNPVRRWAFHSTYAVYSLLVCELFGGGRRTQRYRGTCRSSCIIVCHGSLYSSIHGRSLTSTTAFQLKLCKSLQKRSGLALSRFTSQAIQPSCYLLCLSIISLGFESCSSSLSYLRSSKPSTSEISAMFGVRSSSLSMPDIAAGLLSSYISVSRSSKTTSRVTRYV